MLIVRVIRLARYYLGLAPQSPSQGEQAARITLYPPEERRVRKQGSRASATDSDAPLPTERDPAPQVRPDAGP